MLVRVQPLTQFNGYASLFMRANIIRDNHYPFAVRAVLAPLQTANTASSFSSIRARHRTAKIPDCNVGRLGAARFMTTSHLFVYRDDITQAQMRPEDLAILKQAKGPTWYDDWHPYCTQVQKECSSLRMIRRVYGFECPDCGNRIGWDLQRLPDSPLNGL